MFNIFKLIFIRGGIMRILIVEDEFNLADAIKSKLEKEKYEVDISSGGSAR